MAWTPVDLYFAGVALRVDVEFKLHAQKTVVAGKFERGKLVELSVEPRARESFASSGIARLRGFNSMSSGGSLYKTIYT